MILWNAKEILRSRNFKIFFSITSILFVSLQLLHFNNTMGYDTNSFVAGHIFIDGNTALYIPLVSFIVPLIVLLVGTYDNVYSENYIKYYISKRMGEKKYFRSRTIAIGLVTFSSFLLIGLVLIVINSLIGQTDVSFGVPEEWVVPYISARELLNIVMISTVNIAIIFSLIAMGIYFLSNLISFKRKITTLVVIQIVVLGFHLLLFFSGELFEYTSYTRGWMYIETEQGPLGFPTIVRGSSLIGRAIFFDIDSVTYIFTTDITDLYTPHVVGALITTVLVLIIYFLLPLLLVNIKNVFINLKYRKEQKTDRIKTVKIDIEKVKHILMFVLPSFIFISVYGLLMLFVDSELNIGQIFSGWYSEHRIDDYLIIETLIPFWLGIGLLVYLVVISYHIVVETEVFYSKNKFAIFVRYSNRTKYYLNVLIKSIKTALIHYGFFMLFVLIFFPPFVYNYSGFILIFIPLLFSFVTLAVILSIFINLSNSYVSLIYMLLLMVGSIFIQIIMGVEIIPDYLYTYNLKKVIMLYAIITPIFNFQIINYIPILYDQIGLNPELGFTTTTLYFIIILLVQAVVIILLSMLYIKIGKSKDKEFR